MRTFFRLSLVFVLCLGAAGVLSGCARYEENAKEAAESHFEQRGFPGSVKESDVDNIKPSTDGEPSNHEMMAMFMLQQAGWESDLSTYERVDLVTMTLEDGSEVKAVVLDEGSNVVFPQSMEGGE